MNVLVLNGFDESQQWHGVGDTFFSLILRLHSCGFQALDADLAPLLCLYCFRSRALQACKAEMPGINWSSTC